VKRKSQIAYRKPATARHATRDMRYAICESGFTLVELLAVLAIIAVVTGLLALILYQFFSITRWGNDQLRVDGDLRNTGVWLVRDGSGSVSFSPSGTCGVFTAPTLTTTRTITYTYSAAQDTLSRQDSGTGQTIAVARHATGVLCPTVVVTNTAAFSVTAASDDVSASQIYTITMRVDQ
jgi:prepilin-type N-terminal cleavage/methylation domain-containing protein